MDLSGRNEIDYENLDKLFQKRYAMSVAEPAVISNPEKFKSSCDMIFQDQYKSNTTFNEACRTLLTYLSIAQSTGFLTDKNNSCGYANYWLNNKVRNENGTSDMHTTNFFTILTSSSNEISNGICNNHIYFLTDIVFTEIKTLYEFYDQFNKFKVAITTDYNGSCKEAQKCATIYKDNVSYCHNYKTKFCSQLLKYRNELMNLLQEKKMCADQQGFISQIDKSPADSSLQSVNGLSSPVIISITLIGTIFGVFLLSLFLYKFSPLGAWITHLIGKIKKKGCFVDEVVDQSLFHHYESDQKVSIYRDYNIPYNFAEY
ncbi:PIR Superfamily Protein [Plasmodium ovale curtisi]|uniref:PIR Superfamily Protein n=1 Tax=Plasmodium ovale curtisi TaxID=864141 RepID=A0A1A8WRR9_PLAOA|nr:PIR Superfamily Protein [Plasmodium ovale curtisi]